LKREKNNNYLCAGGPSIIIFIHNICIAFNGFGNFIKVDIMINAIAAILLYREERIKRIRTN